MKSNSFRLTPLSFTVFNTYTSKNDSRSLLDHLPLSIVSRPLGVLDSQCRCQNWQENSRIRRYRDAAKGFEHEFQRNYSTAGTQRKHSLVLLANVEDKHIVDVPGDGSQSSDKTAADDIERQALAIPAPAKSLNPSADRVGL